MVCDLAALRRLICMVHPGQRLRLNTLRVLAARSGLHNVEQALASPAAFVEVIERSAELGCLVVRDAQGAWWRRRWTAAERGSVVVDLSNVLWTCRSRDPVSGDSSDAPPGRVLRASSAVPVLHRLAALGLGPIHLVADHSLPSMLRDPAGLADLQKVADSLTVAPPGTPADPLLFELAREHPCLILSNDRFRDWRRSSSWHRRTLHRIRIPFVAPDSFGEAEAELLNPPPEDCSDDGAALS